MARWRNWGRTASCRPHDIESVDGEFAIVDAIRRASAKGLPVKVVGSGHSFTDIACTTGVMLSMDRYDGVIEIDHGNGTARVQAGIGLRSLNLALASEGLALENLGDIAYQTIAGAISTGTHGTGLRFGNLATQVAGLRLVTASGEALDLSDKQDPDTFKAAQVSLGALGVISTVTLRCVPAFDLYADESGTSVDGVLEALDEIVDGNEHAEFYWFPHTDVAHLKLNNRTDRPPTPPRPVKAFVGDYVMSNLAFGALCRIGRARPEAIPSIARFVGGQVGRKRVVQPSYEVFASPRLVRFAEMEYAIPREHAREAVMRLRSFIDDEGLRISFPIEVRFVAADDIWLSPAYGRQTCYIAVHAYRGTPYERYFRGVESIMRTYEGRPHWGKIHYRTAADLRDVYPRWDDFAAVRSRLDPQGLFRNAYLDRVLGPRR